jgi:hypothetical protein
VLKPGLTGERKQARELNEQALAMGQRLKEQRSGPVVDSARTTAGGPPHSSLVQGGERPSV